MVHPLAPLIYLNHFKKVEDGEDKGLSKVEDLLEKCAYTYRHNPSTDETYMDLKRDLLVGAAEQKSARSALPVLLKKGFIQGLEDDRKMQRQVQRYINMYLGDVSHDEVRV